MLGWVRMNGAKSCLEPQGSASKFSCNPRKIRLHLLDAMLFLKRRMQFPGAWLHQRICFVTFIYRLAAHFRAALPTGCSRSFDYLQKVLAVILSDGRKERQIISNGQTATKEPDQPHQLWRRCSVWPVGPVHFFGQWNFPLGQRLGWLKKKERHSSEPADGERGKKRHTCGKRGTQIRLLVICYLFFLLFSLSVDTPTTWSALCDQAGIVFRPLSNGRRKWVDTVSVVSSRR